LVATPQGPQQCELVGQHFRLGRAHFAGEFLLRPISDTEFVHRKPFSGAFGPTTAGRMDSFVDQNIKSSRSSASLWDLQTHCGRHDGGGACLPVNLVQRQQHQILFLHPQRKCCGVISEIVPHARNTSSTLGL
jgi:hypothetical protein